jgi:hypothetical protein
MKEDPAKHLIGCCGLFCGLCAKYQSTAPSRCIGCRKGEQHSWCSIWNCCVKKHGFETCAECRDVFTCEIFTRRKVTDWVPAADNLRSIKQSGTADWLKEQAGRLRLVDELIRKYNEGRSTGFYCKVCARMPVKMINQAIQESKKRMKAEKVDSSDVKAAAKITKSVMADLAVKADINF